MTFIKRIFPVWISVQFLLFSCSNTSNEKIVKNDTVFQKIEPDFLIKSYPVSTGWGYSIYVQNRILIKQDNIPAVGGMKEFKTSIDALNTASLAVKKIQHNLFPPTISIHELDSLKVLY